jgi:hypothetical protein
MESCDGIAGVIRAPYSPIRASATRKGPFAVKGNVIDAI